MKNNISKKDIERELKTITKQLIIESGQVFNREVKLDDSFTRHLGIDSLGRAELFQRIEKTFSVSIPDQLIAEAETLTDVVSYLENAATNINKNEIKQQMILSHGERVAVKYQEAKTLIDVLLLYGETASNTAHIYFQHDDGREEVITYGNLLKQARIIAASLRRLGLKEGETVAIMQPTNPGFFYTFFGVLLAGGIPVPIYPPFRAHMIEAYAKVESRILQNAEVRILVTFDKAQHLSQLLKAFVPSLRVVTTVADLMSDEECHDIFRAHENNFAFIQYTSGSTSDPKGVLLSHFNLITNISCYGKAINVQPNDVTVSWLPLYHDMGLIGMWLGSLYFGVPLVLMSPFSFLNRPERWLWAIHHHRGTLSGAPNFAYDLCVRKIDPALIEGIDLSSWRMAANGAEKIYPKTLEQFAEKFAPYGFKRNAILPVYGLAESTVALTIPSTNESFHVDHIARKAFEEEKRAVPSTDKNALAFVGCGVPILHHDIRIVDENNNVLPERTVGHLQFSGPSMMQGYYNNPNATKAILHDGWMDTGDLAYISQNELFITGRRKDLIIKAGRNLYPVEIEELAGNVPGIRQGCVIAFGINDAKHGTEQLVIVAETKEKNKTKRLALIEKVKEKVAETLDLVPDHVELVSPHTVPKTSSGKLQRAACKTMYINGMLGQWKMPPWMQVVKLGAAWLISKVQQTVRWIGKLFYSLYIFMLVFISILPLWIIAQMVRREKLARLLKGWANVILKLALCPIEKSGTQYLNANEKMVYVANHASYVDSILMLALVPEDTRFVGKKELFRVPFIRTFMQKLHFIPVDRMDFAQGLEDTKHIEAVLEKGHSVFIFPEGTFSYASGLRPFRVGAFKIAAETNTPICPIALKGTRYVLRDSEIWMSPHRVQVTVSKPIKSHGNEWQDVTQLKNEVRAEIAKNCGEPLLDYIAAQKVAQKPNKS